jgi:hypothetical protein
MGSPKGTTLLTPGVGRIHCGFSLAMLPILAGVSVTPAAEAEPHLETLVLGQDFADVKTEERVGRILA